MRAIHISQRKYTNKRSSMLKICANFDCNTIIGPLSLQRAGKPPIIVDAKKSAKNCGGSKFGQLATFRNGFNFFFLYGHLIE